MKHPIPIILLCLVTLIANARTSMGFQTKGSSLPQGASNSNPHADKIKSQVKKVGTGGKVTVKLANTREYHGTIKWIDENNFQLDEVDLKQVVVVNYTETKKVYAGYGSKGFGGKRVNRHSTLIALGTLAGILAIGLFVASQTK